MLVRGAVFPVASRIREGPRVNSALQCATVRGGVGVQYRRLKDLRGPEREGGSCWHGSCCCVLCRGRQYDIQCYLTPSAAPRVEEGAERADNRVPPPLLPPSKGPFESSRCFVLSEFLSQIV